VSAPRVRRPGPCLVAAVLALMLGLIGCGSGAKSPREASVVVTPTPTAAASPGNGTKAWHPPGATTPGSLPPVVSSGRRTEPMVALTFDSNLTDYMISELNSGAVASFYNSAVVDILEQEQVPTTFLLTGKWMERYPEATRRLAANPMFELGSHSYAHAAFHTPCYTLASLPIDQMAADVERSFTVLSAFTNRPTRYFRFPGDCYDDAALRAIAPVGCTVIHYDVASGDAFGTNVDAIVRQTLTRVHNGSIVVMHITGGNTAPLTAKALPRIIDGLRAKGFRLVRVSTLLGQEGGG
jgi:peptidoglycan/xylan/chitin deacetylase (PgdA/CDA1 family)